MPNLKLRTLYNISFLLFYIIPLTSIFYKLFNSYYEDMLFDVIFLGTISLISLIFLKIPSIINSLIYFVISAIVFYIGFNALGLETRPINITFDNEANNAIYIILFIILCIQLLSLLVYTIYKRKTIYQPKKTFQNSKESYPVFYSYIFVFTLITYIISIITKTILDINIKYINFEISILLGYLFFYTSLVLLMRFLFKDNIINALKNAAFFISLFTIGIAIGILFFQEHFLQFKLTTLLIGTINLSFITFNIIKVKISAR